MMRLDKFVSQATGLSRSQSRLMIKKGHVYSNNAICRNISEHVSATDKISFDGKPLAFQRHLYLALHKPAGYICSSKDEAHPSTLNLLTDIPQYQIRNLHFAGRLDLDTTGLCLITTDGQWSHCISSPRKDCLKRYRVTSASALLPLQIEQLEAGVILNNEQIAVSAKSIDVLSDSEMIMTISEGKYHQVKRMLAAVGNHVNSLHRISIGGVDCHSLAEGEWRELSDEEISSFR